MLRAGSQDSKRLSHSFDLENRNIKQTTHVHQRSASESGMIQPSAIEKQGKMVSFYRKLSTRRTMDINDKFKKSRESIGLAISNFLPKQNYKHTSVMIKSTYLLDQKKESRYSLPNVLQQEINQFSIDGYAQKYFSTHKKGLFRRTVPVDEMLKWTPDTIRQPLLNEKSHKREALKCFKVLQIWMGDRVKPKHYDLMKHVQILLDCGISKGPMRDEIYVQICRQLNHNPKSESIKKGWEMMCIVTITFPPSKDLESYLYNFVKESVLNENTIISRYVLSRLERICLKGAKGKTLTVAEIERAIEAPFKPSVFGETLENIMKFENNQVPQIMVFLTEAIRNLDGKRTEGIFRVPGDADIITELRVRIENGNYDITGIYDPNVPASLLKYWLRDLSEPLIPTHVYQKCIDNANDKEKIDEIIFTLPDYNQRIIFYITQFLQEFTEPKVVEHTLMTLSNLAMVFAPNYFQCPSTHLPTLFENSKYEQTFVKTLISKIN